MLDSDKTPAWQGRWVNVTAFAARSTYPAGEQLLRVATDLPPHAGPVLPFQP